MLFLNDDVEVISPEWLSQMVGYAQTAGVGAVGAWLLYKDQRIQHAGVIHGLNDGLTGHANKLLAASEFGYLCYSKVAREYSAVTAACLLMRRSLFSEIGGFDETDFKVAYNDVDLCYRIVDAGFRCIYCPTAELYHYEGRSRGFGDNPAEEAALRRKYAGRIDPWYNPNLSLRSERFEIHPYRRPSHRRQTLNALFVSHNLNREGAPKSLLELVRGLQAEAAVDPCVMHPTSGPLASEYQELRIPLVPVQHPLTDVGASELYRQRIAELSRGLLQSGCQIVVANTAQSFWAVDAARQANIPAIWIIRESEPWNTYFDFVPDELRSRCYHLFQYPYRVVGNAEMRSRIAHSSKTVRVPYLRTQAG